MMALRVRAYGLLRLNRGPRIGARLQLRGLATVSEGAQ